MTNSFCTKSSLCSAVGVLQYSPAVVHESDIVVCRSCKVLLYPSGPPVDALIYLVLGVDTVTHKFVSIYGDCVILTSHSSKRRASKICVSIVKRIQITH